MDRRKRVLTMMMTMVGAGMKMTPLLLHFLHNEEQVVLTAHVVLVETLMALTRVNS